MQEYRSYPECDEEEVEVTKYGVSFSDDLKYANEEYRSYE